MNRAHLLALPLLGALAACNGSDDPPPPPLLDTGWFTTTTSTTEVCVNKIVSWTPEEGAQGVYWRDKPVIYTSTNTLHAYTVWLETADGERVPTEMVAVDATGLKYTLDWEGNLAANTDYVLGLQDCDETRFSHFRTSGLGEPLSIEPDELSGRTFLVDLVNATWDEPPGLGGVMAQYFTTPILLGVRFADDNRVDLIGAPGLTDDFGGVTQDKSTATWDFPLTDFTEAPYLEITAPSIMLKYGDVEIPVEDFTLKITFGPDGTTLGGGVLEGLGDSRNLYQLLPVGGGEPDAICELASTLGISCQPCADGQNYCLHLVASDLEGSLLPGVVLVELD